MSIYDRMISKAGKNGLYVDTRLERPEGVRVGQELRGNVVLKNGQGARRVRRISLELAAEFIYEKDKRIAKQSGVIYRYMLDTDVSMASGEERSIPFAFTIPFAAPVKLGPSNVWLETEVETDPESVRTDKDSVTILPHPIVSAFFEAVGLLGLRLHEVSLLRMPDLQSSLPFVQEFEFKPRLPSALDEIEVYYLVKNERQVDFYMEIDRRGKGLLGMLEETFDWDERCVKVTLTDEDIADPDRLAGRLAHVIKPHLDL